MERGTPVSVAAEIDLLAEVSARIGRNPLLVQAATGNTSIKIGGVLWIKASGKWLAHATRDQIFVPVDLEETRRRIEGSFDPAGQTAIVEGNPPGASVETAMHAVLPHAVVFHVHSVNTIAWAVREDAIPELTRRLAGICWQWIPYVSSGLPLARAVRNRLRQEPDTEVLILANHGLVICGKDCASAEELLLEVERRVAVRPREAGDPDWQLLTGLARGFWRLPQDAAVHALSTDPVSHRILSDGVLYPCQAIFLGPKACSVRQTVSAGELEERSEPFLMAGNAGVLVREKPNPAALATLSGVAQVVRRIPASAPIRYLAGQEVSELLCADVYRYRDRVEDNAAQHRPLPRATANGHAGRPPSS